MYNIYYYLILTVEIKVYVTAVLIPRDGQCSKKEIIIIINMLLAA